MIRRCAGPAGEPGFAVEIDGVQGVCHTYDPAVPDSKLLAERAVVREHMAADEAAAAAT